MTINYAVCTKTFGGIIEMEEASKSSIKPLFIGFWLLT